MTICVTKDPKNLTLPGCTAIFTTIQEGLDAAAKSVDKTVIVDGQCSQGRCVYKENVKFPSGGIALVGRGYPIIDGGHVGRVVEIFPDDHPELESSISGFEIINGKTEGNGAGIFAESTPVTINDNCIHDNFAEGTGGGICIEYKTTEFEVYGPSTVSNNSIYKNQAWNGGGIGARGDMTNDYWKIPETKPLVIIKSNVIGPDNKVAGDDFVYGAGICVYELPVLIEGNEIHHNNSSMYGGGVAAYNVDRTITLEEIGGALNLEVYGSPSYQSAKQVLLNKNHIHHNTAWKGGGVAGMWFAVVNYSENIIEENSLLPTKDSHGGGIYGTTAGIHRFTKNLITKNRAVNSPDGRGGAIHASCNAVISFEGDNIVLENEAENYGGGISLDNADIFAWSGTLYIAKNKVTKGYGWGGGIYACSSDSADKLSTLKWQPCNHNNWLSLHQCLVEFNRSLGHGAGIAVDKTFAGFNAVRGDATIEGSVIRNNFATDPGSDGIYFKRDAKASVADVFKLSNSLVEMHNGDNMSGVRIDDAFGKSIIESSIIKENDDGLVFGELSSSKLSANQFLRNSRSQLRLQTLASDAKVFLPDVEVEKNSFEGDHVSSLGIEFQKNRTKKTELNSNSPKIFGNDIMGHTKYGMESETPVSAPANYWGSADGPTRPDGKGKGDKITKEVNPDVFSPNPINLMAPLPPNLKPPQAPTFTPPSTPNCENLAEKIPRRVPQTQNPSEPQTLPSPPPENPPQEQTPVPPQPQAPPPQPGKVGQQSYFLKTPDAFVTAVFLGLLLIVPLVLGFAISSSIESPLGLQYQDYIRVGLSTLVVALLLLTAYILRNIIFPPPQQTE